MTSTTAWIPGPPEAPDLSTWWKRLDYARQQIGMSVNQMAKDLGYSESTFATWLHGARPQDLLDVIDRAVRAYNLDRDWLTWGDEDRLRTDIWAAQLECLV